MAAFRNASIHESPSKATYPSIPNPSDPARSPAAIAEWATMRRTNFARASTGCLFDSYTRYFECLVVSGVRFEAMVACKETRSRSWLFDFGSVFSEQGPEYRAVAV